MLPSISKLKEWSCEPVVERLMHDYKWPRETAKLWFQDFMYWLYSSQKWKEQLKTRFSMDTMHYLDDVWHAYILHTEEYFKMCKQLFGEDYIHHTPAPSFKKELIDKEAYQKQLVFLLEEWGEDYINRVWGFAADISDLLHGDYQPTAS